MTQRIKKTKNHKRVGTYTALKESNDPLDQILMDVMHDYFYYQRKNRLRPL